MPGRKSFIGHPTPPGDEVRAQSRRRSDYDLSMIERSDDFMEIRSASTGKGPTTRSDGFMQVSVGIGETDILIRLRSDGFLTFP